MRSRIAEIRQHAIAQVLGDMPLIARDDLLTDGLIGHYAGMVVFWIELLRKGRGPHQVDEFHGQLAPLAYGLLGFG